MMRGAAWVAGSVRARALVRRRLGPASARGLASSDRFEDAVERLTRTPYGRDVRVGDPLPTAEHAVEATLLWHLRVLAGWLPPAGVTSLRALAGWFEIRAVERHIRRLRGLDAGPAHRLGSMALAASRLTTTSSLDGLRTALTASAWGDPGDATPRAVAIGMRLAWAQRVAAEVPTGEAWAAGAAAILIAREHWLTGCRLEPGAAARASTLLGARSMTVTSFADYVDALPARARWALDGLAEPSELWRAEARWWRRLDGDGAVLLHGSRFDERAVLGAVLALTVDAWRVRAALACAAGVAPVELLDAVTIGS